VSAGWTVEAARLTPELALSEVEGRNLERSEGVARPALIARSSEIPREQLTSVCATRQSYFFTSPRNRGMTAVFKLLSRGPNDLHQTL